MDTCGGRRRVLSVIKDERVPHRILDHLGTAETRTIKC
jgi:hypothetical protein